MHIAVLTERRYVGDGARSGKPPAYVANVLMEDRLVVEALAAEGFEVSRVAWCDKTMDWNQVDAALFRTTWDYFDRWSEFSTWLEKTAPRTHMFNAPDILSWNLDKHYLRDLGHQNADVVPTEFADCGDGRSLLSIAQSCGWNEVVIKPAIAGAAKDTYRIHVGNGAMFPASSRGFESLWTSLVEQQDMLVQPFLPGVVNSGELSLIWMDGSVTHAVSKHAKTGDFRVQDDHGGSVRTHPIQSDERDFANQVMQACLAHCQQQGWPKPLYARVDMVRDLEGDWALSELEMVEPELWFRHHPPAAQTLAKALSRRLSER